MSNPNRCGSCGLVHVGRCRQQIVDSVDSQVSRQADHQVIVHIIHMTCAGQNASGQSVDTVDTLDVRFKSLYPFCLFFKQVGFSFNDLYYPQYPQNPATHVRRGLARGSTPHFFTIHRASTTSTKRSGVNLPGKTPQLTQLLKIVVDHVKKSVTLNTSTTTWRIHNVHISNN